jgi:two-component system cell cycle sensor histidine kinase PleC
MFGQAPGIGTERCIVRVESGVTQAELQQRIEELEAEVAALRAGGEQARLRQFFQVIEASPYGTVVHRTGAPLYANAKLAEMLGVPLATYMAAASILDYVHEQDREAVAEFARRFLAGEPLASTGEFRLLCHDGSKLWVECKSARIDWGGAPAVLSVMSDISARHAAENELRQSRKLFQSVFHATPDVITITDMSTGLFVDVNRAFLEYSRFPREAVVGQRPADVGIYADTAFRQELQGRVDVEGSVRDVEAVAHTVRGERTFSVSAETVQVGGRRLMLAMGRDITAWRRQEDELRRSQKAAERANRAKSEFLASMSHELRTPLNAIIGFSEVIRDGIFGAIGVPRYAEYAKDINESGQHLLQIINDLLDLTKLEAGKFELHESSVIPAQVIESCLRLVKTRAEHGGVSVVPAVSADLPAVCGDARLLKQIMINLLSNAVKFTPRGGRIEAGARLLADGTMAFYVADTGIGMSTAEVEIALTPFGQVDGVLSRTHQGTGLGLPLARSLAELHGGTLTVDSQPGEGTEVTISLPAERVFVDDPGRVAANGL